MLKSLQYWVLCALGGVCVLLVVANIVMFSSNRALQRQVNERAQYIQQTVQLQSLYQQLARALADLSVRNQDDQLRGILARQGINVTAKPPQPSSSGSGSTGDKPTRQRNETRHE